jgi:hypothetical protein
MIVAFGLGPRRRGAGRELRSTPLVGVLGIGIVGVIVGMAAFAVLASVLIAPQVAADLHARGVTDLPPAWRVLIQISHFMTTKWYLVLGLLTAIGLATPPPTDPGGRREAGKSDEFWSSSR